MLTKEYRNDLAQEQASQTKWWMEEYGFFGNFYIEGDNSSEGYFCDKKQTLEERTNCEVDGVIKLLDLTPSSLILDCPCGYGRHSIGLLERNIRVIGCDINSVHLNKAISDAKVKRLPYDFRKQNMIDLTFCNEFDGIINMFYSFGFFDTDKENFKVLLNFYDALKPGGKFLMHTDVNMPRINMGKYKFDEDRKLASGNMLRIIDVYDEQTKRIDGKWIIGDGSGRNRELEYSVRVYSKDEFESLCRHAGFSKVNAYSNWEGDEYSESAEDMIIVAEK